MPDKTIDNTDFQDETDGRKAYDYKSKYDSTARTEIRYEAIFLMILLLFSIFILFYTWKGGIYSFLDIGASQELIAKKYIYYSAAGMLGGIIFGMKFFYRAVARGLWHQDRRVWRLLSPLISAIVALITGVLIDASLLKTEEVTSGAAIVSIGFLAGYFADEAVGKMYEIANVIFGANKNK
ncbi:hypothetical protein KKG72_01575 [bacterium]|nr:hypothetical protein [bacterium]MBU1993172.1 hypothetical protein [bacterium]